MSSLDQSSEPEGMLDRNFQMLKQQVATMLDGAVGLSYLAIEDYPQARIALEQAVASDPNNAQLVYGMGLALLNGEKSRPISRLLVYGACRQFDSRNAAGAGDQQLRMVRYVKDGGKAEGWQRYQASAAALDAPPNPDTGKPSANTVVASSSPQSAPAEQFFCRRQYGKFHQAHRKACRDDGSVKWEKPSGKEEKRRLVLKIRCMSRLDLKPRAVPNNPAKRPKVIAAPSEAVSLGILIETSLLSNQNRPGRSDRHLLKDIVRNLAGQR